MEFKRGWLVPAMICITLVAFAGMAAAEGETTGSKSAKSAKVEKAEKKATPKVAVYYFHGGQRCANCIKIESYTEEAMKTVFADAIKSGEISWNVVDWDKKENAHVVKDYQLVTKSVVAVKMNGNKAVEYKNLTDIWTLLGNKKKFQDYIVKEVNAYLGAG